MKKLMVIVLLLAFGQAYGESENTVHPNYFEIGDVSVVEIADEVDFQNLDQNGLKPDCESSFSRLVPKFSSSDISGDLDIDGWTVLLDQVVNIGKKVWSVVEANKPVVNVKMETANALPKGLTCWLDLQGWQMPVSKAYRATYKNLFGMTVVDFAFRVTFTYGGSMNGLGRYITNMTMMPKSLYVAWGYQFNAEGNVPSVFNMGTRTSPIAGMQAVLKWQVDTALNHHEASESFSLAGDGRFEKLQ